MSMKLERNRVAADTHAGGLAKTVVGGLLNRFMGQRARAERYPLYPAYECDPA